MVVDERVNEGYRENEGEKKKKGDKRFAWWISIESCSYVPPSEIK